MLRDEAKVLGGAEGQAARAGDLARLRRAVAPRHVAELENDVLLLDDLIGRQRLEDLAALGKELTDAHQRLRDLLERYQKTKDPALRRQLEREARELRARLAELAQKIAAVKARNDVPEEWRNMPDLKNVADAGAQAGRDAREGQRRRPGAARWPSWATIWPVCARCWIRTRTASAPSGSRRRTGSSPI